MKIYHVRLKVLSRVVYTTALCFGLMQCQKDEPTPHIATLSTTALTAITKTTAMGGGKITKAADPRPTERGVCYSTSSGPTVDGDKVVSTDITDNFSASLTGLAAGTKYYVRAYVINSTGVAYGDELNFTTDPTDVYLFGNVQLSGYYYPAYWKNGTLLQISETEGYISDMKVSGADVYAAGFIYVLPNYTNKPAIWKNGTVSTYENATEGRYVSMALDGEDVYVVGYDQTGVKYWKNGVGTALTGANGIHDAKSIYVTSNHDVFVVAHFFDPNSGYTRAGVWKNGVLQDLGFGYAHFVTVNEQDVYVSGEFANPNGTWAGYGYWKNGTKVIIEAPANSNYQVSQIAINNNDIYLAGYVTTNSVVTAHYWKNGTAYSLSNPNSAQCYPYSIGLVGDDVYVSGTLNDVGAMWINGALSTQFNGTNNIVYATNLYVVDK